MAEETTQQDNKETKQSDNRQRGGQSDRSGRGGRRGGGGRGRGRGGDSRYDQQVIEIRRVARTVKGGKRMRFRALVVIGDRKGSVGVGLRKGVDVAEAVNKAIESAKKNMVKVSLSDGTIPHQITYKYKASSVFLKPASPGTGVIAGGAVRQVLDLAGVKNVLSKSYGSRNKVNTLMATFNALGEMETREDMNTKLKGSK